VPAPPDPPPDATLPNAGTDPTTSGSASSTLRDALEEARPSDPPARVLAQARVAAALFGAEAGTFGRFRVLEQLGVGGMGVVYAAYDPDLDRGVALKLVHTPAKGREAALAEAKALARLSHPNVVPVFDVGIERDHVYIVMELVRGTTLRRWAIDRDWPSVLAAYRQAGEALAAAHAKGLVHRDFKPDNAIIGRDGRVRVVDFGLACEAADADASTWDLRGAAGTPGYIAPEHAAGAPATPAADQYSFCVSLAEALRSSSSSSSIPRWVEAVIERGSARAPAERFASMAELLGALGHDPARVRRRRIVAAVLALVGVSAFFGGRATLTARVDPCADGEARLAWSPGARGAALTRIASLDGYGKSVAPRIERQLADHAARWTAGYREACLARRRGIESDALADRRMACLERGRVALRSVAAIAESADAKALADVVLAARALPDPDACGDLDALLSEVDPPAPPVAAAVARIRAGIEDARVQIAAGRLEKALAGADATVVEARAAGYRPALAEALLVQGRTKMAMSPRVHALAPLAEAATVGFEVGADAIGVEAWARHAWVQGMTGEPASALAGLEVVQAVAARPRSTKFARALLYNNVGGVELAREHRAEARAAFERALEESRGVTGPGSIELLNIRRNLALTTDDLAAQERILTDAEAELAKTLGEEHPETLEARWTRAVMVVQLAKAVELLSPACEGFELHPSLAARAAMCWSDLGFLRRELGDEAGAILAMDRAARAPAEDTSDSPEVAPYLLLWKGDARGAADRFRAAIAERRPSPDEAWWERQQRAELELGLGRALRAMGSFPAARSALESSVAVLAVVAREHPAAKVDRALCRARAELALTLAALGRRDARVAELAAAASSRLKIEGARSVELQELDRLAGQRGTLAEATYPR
jgi:tetratricopeptide (TPR) repeat protein/predicted Ser/Thr protein kinase